MSYDSGNSYAGDFSKNQFGNRGLYRWSDGTEYEGSWKDGYFSGIGIYRVPNGGVDYSLYKDGNATGVGVFWSAGYREAYHTLDGVKMSQTSLTDAETLAKDKFGLPAPSLKPELGITSRIFRQKTVGPDGKHLYKDNGYWGSFIGELNASGDRHNQGTMIYESGSVYVGAFAKDKYNGDGIFTYPNGDAHDGEWKDGEPHGKGIFRSADGSIEYSMYEAGKKVGSTAVLTPKSNVPASSYFGTLFFDKKTRPVRKMLYNDDGHWGSFEGDVDEAGDRQGKGKMTYNNGNYYEGGFVDSKFECDRGVYHWADGDEYEGSWKAGERDGKGRFQNMNGSVEYVQYEHSEAKGDGLLWSADRKIAHKTLDGYRKSKISLTMAANLAKEMFDLPVPKLATSAVSSSFFSSLFATRKAGPDGNMLYKDHGNWGSYDGELDEAGHRQGKGKMTYACGDYYKGYFVDDTYDCDRGVYHWADGEEYDGGWKAGERHGKGCFENADGTVEYSNFENGEPTGEGVTFSADHETAYTLLDGKKKLVILVEEAESMVKEKWSLKDENNL